MLAVRALADANNSWTTAWQGNPGWPIDHGRPRFLTVEFLCNREPHARPLAGECSL